MISVFDAKDYKTYLKDWLAARPKAGRGESRRIAEKLGLSTTLVSQVLNSDKHFTMEAASDLCDHMGLSERETDHFLLLIDYERAGSHNLKTRLKKRIDRSREANRKLSERVERDRDLSEIEAATYYSHWIYTGITNLVAVNPRMTYEEISSRLNIPAAMIVKVMSFLIESGILIQKSGSYDLGSKRILFGPESPLVAKHHQNWRLQGFNRMPFSERKNFFFTLPMSLSAEVADQIRADLPAYIEKITGWVGPSKSEVVRCLNIDYFEY